MKKTILPALACLALVSCKTSSYTYRSANIADHDIIASQVVVDTKLDLANRIETMSSKRNTVNEAMEEAYYKAIATNRIDVVVSPIFEITTADKFLFWGGKTTAKLSGFGATYENSRSKINAIKELKGVDTTDIKKFDAIYNRDGYNTVSRLAKHEQPKSFLGSLPIIGGLFR